MLEILLCSLLTIFPDYLIRRYGQGKRLGREITFFSVWFELRWGIISCLVLTVALISAIFYFHPATSNVTAFFRTMPIIPEANGRVAEIFVGGNTTSNDVAQGAPIFRLDSTKQAASLETARRAVTEVKAATMIAQVDLLAAEGQRQQAEAALEQALDELNTKRELNQRNANIVARRDIEKLENALSGCQGALNAATAAKAAATLRVTTLLPAQRASAEAAVAGAQVDLDKTVIRAGVRGHIEQFSLQVGDVVNAFARPAGLLIPDVPGSRRRSLFAGFDQIEGQVMKVGMIAEATCVSKPWTIIPMVVADVQDTIAAGQFRLSDQLIDPRQLAQPGTIVVRLEPLYDGGLKGVIPGSSCIVNAYTSNHDLLASPELGFGRRLALHVVDAVGIVHAMLLRMQALLLPIQTLVFSGH